MATNNILNEICSNGFTASGGTISISTDASAATVNLGTGAAAKTVTLGSTTSTASTTVQAGSTGLSFSITNGPFSVATGTGTVSLSTDAAATTVNLGTGAGVKTVTLGSTNSTSPTTVQSGSGALNITSANGALTINSGTGAWGLSTDASATTVSLATGAAVKTVTLGSTTSTSTTTIRAGTGGVQITNTFLNMPTTTSTAGQLRINNNRVLHTFATSANNDDLFVGQLAGNFTASSTNGGNTACGASALTALTSGELNTIVGANGGLGLTQGTKNTCVGYDGLRSITTGSRNVAIGWNSNSSPIATTASDNIIINSPGVAGDNNTMRIGTGTGTGTQQLNKTFIHGIRGITTVNNDAIAVLIDSAGQLGTVSSSVRYKENIEDMGDFSSLLLKLRPVTFDLIGRKYKDRHVGLIAEEVFDVFPTLVANNEEGEIESVKYQDLPVLLLNEIQKAVKRIEVLESKINK